jgi:hypothetical protein
VVYSLEVGGVPAAKRREVGARVIAAVDLTGWEKKYPDELSAELHKATIFITHDLDIAGRTDGLKDWAISHREQIQPIKRFFYGIIIGIDDALNAMPPAIMLGRLVLIAWQLAERRVAYLFAACLAILGILAPEAWGLAMTTLAIVTSSVLVAVNIGLPLGVLAGKSNRFESFIRPPLDTMQTIPAFVYLVPGVMLVGIGTVSGVIVTIILALPPLVRLTSLGIRSVNPGVVEAARALGDADDPRPAHPADHALALDGGHRFDDLGQGAGQCGSARDGPSGCRQGHRGGAWGS